MGQGVHRAMYLAAALLVACGGEEPSDPLPDAVVGTWRTQAPEYRDRSFELRPEWIVFGTGHHATRMYPIEHVRVTPSGMSTRIRIRYRADDGALLETGIEWIRGRPPQLRVGRRSDVWVPEQHAWWLVEEAS